MTMCAERISYFPKKKKRKKEKKKKRKKEKKKKRKKEKKKKEKKENVGMLWPLPQEVWSSGFSHDERCAQRSGDLMYIMYSMVCSTFEANL